MQLRFLGKDTLSAGGDSPTLYATDRDSFVIQGWKTDGPEVEIPFNLFDNFAKADLHGVTPYIGGPFIRVSDHETCIVRGAEVTDAEALAQMRIPAHESCVEVPRTAIAARLEEGADGDHA